MTRQDQQRLKELKKALPLLIRDLAREKKLKKKDFISNGYHGELREALYYIHEGKYRMALETIGEGEGAFSNGGIDINDAIRNYCLKSI